MTAMQMAIDFLESKRKQAEYEKNHSESNHIQFVAAENLMIGLEQSITKLEELRDTVEKEQLITAHFEGRIAATLEMYAIPDRGEDMISAEIYYSGLTFK